MLCEAPRFCAACTHLCASHACAMPSNILSWIDVFLCCTENVQQSALCFVHCPDGEDLNTMTSSPPQDANYLKERLLDQAWAPFTPPFGGHSRSVPQCMIYPRTSHMMAPQQYQWNFPSGTGRANGHITHKPGGLGQLRLAKGGGHIGEPRGHTPLGAEPSAPTESCMWGRDTADRVPSRAGT